MGKEKVYIFHIYFFKFQRLTYTFSFFQRCKKTAKSATSNFTHFIVFFESIHFQGFFAFAVGLDTDKEIFK